MKLISEEVQNAEYLVEEKNGKKEYKIRGVFLQSEIKNRNGRVYPQEIMVREVNRYTKEFINKNRAFGELGHPDGPTVNLERVCHMVKSLKQDGKDFIGEAKIMDTPYGKIVKGLIDEGAQLGVSSRGMGSLITRNGVNYVNDDFYLATAADIVADPSAPDAFVEGIMESKEWVWNNGVLHQVDLENWKKQVQEARRPILEQAKLKVFQSFLTKL
jgi:hypothetical protein|tara:strand:- start:1131 stop:1775 length:645 start_codon:yes stop_codon:yes gene_type:complete